MGREKPTFSAKKLDTTVKKPAYFAKKVMVDPIRIV